MRLPYFGNQVEPNAVAVLNAEQKISYAELVADVLKWQRKISHPEKLLVFFYLENSIDAVAPLLACLERGFAVALLDIKIPDNTKNELESNYEPDLVFYIHNGIVNFEFRETPKSFLQCDLSVLLSTSGSTGSPKFVRLSKNAIKSNAFAIASSQNLTSKSRASGHLDIHYSYGMSVVFSHLATGASIAFCNYSFLEKKFWETIHNLKVTHLPGVPFHFQMMRRLRIERMNLPRLGVMTQAGGRLDTENQKYFYELMNDKNGRFLIMYGQTEAAPRISTLKHCDFKMHQGSVGQSLDGGKIQIVDEEGNEKAPGEEGLVQFTGPNVMLGYAKNRLDLGKPDENGGVLQTGDFGIVDANGFLTITGRSERMGKVYGWRINLDEIEKNLNETLICAVVQVDETIYIAHEKNDKSQGIIDAMIKNMSLPASIFKSICVETIAKTERGKTDYKHLKAILSD